MMLVTGATGAVGRALCLELSRRGLAFRPTSRRRRFGHLETGDLTADTDWSRALRGVDVVVHLAQVPLTPGDRKRSMAAAQLNADIAAGLAQQAARAGASRLVVVSRLTVHGSESAPGRAIRSADPLAPADDLSRGALLLEQSVRAVAEETGLALCVLRAAPLYGPDGGMLAPLIAAVREQRPLMLASVTARRSYCAVSSLAALLIDAASHSRAVGRALLAADPDPIAAPDLIREIAALVGTEARLRPLPVPLYELGLTVAGRRREALTLTRPLVADLTDTTSILGNGPALSLQDRLRAALVPAPSGP